MPNITIRFVRFICFGRWNVRPKGALRMLVILIFRLICLSSQQTQRQKTHNHNQKRLRVQRQQMQCQQKHWQI